MTAFWFAASGEEFTPTEMLAQARAADEAGFDALGASDHWAPWFPEGRGSQAWVFLSALSQHTSKPLFTSVTPLLHHYDPAVVAQAFASLAELHAGEVILGTGSGEAVNEVPLGLDWPSPGEKLRRFDQAMEALNRLLDGETVTMDAGWFRLQEARLYTLPERRPRVIASAFGPQAAAIAARHATGLWTLGDPEQAPGVIDAYRGAGGTGPVVLQVPFHLAPGGLESALKWKPTQFPEVYVEEVPTPEALQEVGRQMSDEELAEGPPLSDDPAEHVEKLRGLIDAGGDVICLQLIGDADPLGSIRRYGEAVLPELRG
jgi:coenzyme F420-dependent glucose-6-phosphate dehydrogenase